MPVSAIADAFGNYDGLLTGYELRFRDRLLELETGSRCWLGFSDRFSPDGSGTGYLQSLEGILDSAEDLDCGDDDKGLKPWDAPLITQRYSEWAIEIRRARGDDFEVYNHDTKIYTKERGLEWWTEVKVFQDTEVILRIPLLKGGTFDEVAAAVLDYYSDGRPKCKGRAEKRYAAWKKALAQGKCPLERIGIFENMDSLSHSTHDERPEDKYKVPKELRCEDDAIDFMAVIDWAAIRECPRTPGSDKLPELLEFFETMTGKGWDASDVALIVIYSEVGKLFHAEYRYDRVRAQEVAESLRTEGQEVSQVLQDLEPVLPLVRPKNYRSASYLKMAALGEHELVEELLRNLEPEKRPTRKYWAHLAKHCWPREELIRKTER